MAKSGIELQAISEKVPSDGAVSYSTPGLAYATKEDEGKIWRVMHGGTKADVLISENVPSEYPKVVSGRRLKSLPSRGSSRMRIERWPLHGERYIRCQPEDVDEVSRRDWFLESSGSSFILGK
jgi:hypothetical protein